MLRETNVAFFYLLIIFNRNLHEEKVFDSDLKRNFDVPEHLRKLYSKGCNHLTDEESYTDMDF